MGWLCVICDTLNTVAAFRNNTCEPDEEICKYCKIKRELYEFHFDHCLVMNERIDHFFPRHHMEWEFKGEMLDRIGYPTFYSERTYKYVFDRLKFRNTQTARSWKRRVCKRKFLKIILNKINLQRNEQIESRLIMNYLL